MKATRSSIAIYQTTLRHIQSSNLQITVNLNQGYEVWGFHDNEDSYVSVLDYATVL
jgi:hypothetical protein